VHHDENSHISYNANFCLRNLSLFSLEQFHVASALTYINVSVLAMYPPFRSFSVAMKFVLGQPK
jgi:hypothetical protein